MTDTFNDDPSTLPPLTKAIRDTWPAATLSSAATDSFAGPAQMRKFLDAIRSLEDRVTALEP